MPSHPPPLPYSPYGASPKPLMPRLMDIFLMDTNLSWHNVSWAEFFFFGKPNEKAVLSGTAFVRQEG